MNTAELNWRSRYQGLDTPAAIHHRVLEVLHVAGMTATDVHVWMTTPNRNIVNSYRIQSPDAYLSDTHRGRSAWLSVLDEAEHHASTWIPGGAS